MRLIKIEQYFNVIKYLIISVICQAFDEIVNILYIHN